MKLVAVIPCYNEEKTVEKVVRKTSKYVEHMVLVNDASSDNTKTILNKLKGKNISVLHNKTNKGKGFTARKGCDYAIKTCKATHLILIDADLQHDPDDIPRFIKKMQEEKASIVFGNRKRDGNMPPIFQIGNWGLSMIQLILFGIWVSDSQSGYRLLTKEAYKAVRWEAQRYTMESEMIARAGKSKLSVAHILIKTVYHDTEKGTTVPAGLKIGWDMLRLRLKLK